MLELSVNDRFVALWELLVPPADEDLLMQELREYSNDSKKQI